MYYYRIVALNSIFGYFVFSAQALLAGMPPDGPAFLAPRYLGQETRGKREFRACWPSFWAFRSWILVPNVLVPGVLVLGFLFYALRVLEVLGVLSTVVVRGRQLFRLS
jgi:hypothetical protein